MMVQTEIGLLPEDWEVVRLEDQFKTFSTASFSRDQMSEQGEIMCVHYGDIHTKFGNIVDANSDEIPFVSASQASRYKPLKDGDVLLADASEDDEGIGKPIAVICHDKKIIAGLHILPLRPKNNECWDVRFPSYLFSGRMVKGQVEKLSEGTKVNSITYNKIKDVLIPLPKDKSEQQNIASALSSIDKLIDDLGRTIQKKQLIREGAMEELLSGKKRLPGFTEEWMEKKICEIGKLTGAGVDKTSNSNEEPVRLLNYLDVYRRNHIANCELHHRVTATPDKIEKCNVKRGDIFFTPSSELPDDIGQSAVAVEDMKGVCYSYHVYRLRPTMENYDADYGAYAFQTEFFFNQVKTQSEGSGKRYVVSLTKFRELSVMLPPSKDEQHAIANILTSMDDEISVLQIEKAKYEQIRSGMMEELLTGKKRLIKK